MPSEESISNREFTDTTFELADTVGTAPIWDLLVNVGLDLADSARERARENDVWEEMADLLERAMREEPAEQIWRRLRETVRVYEAYGLDLIDEPPESGEVEASELEVFDDAGVDVPVTLGVDYVACRRCGNGDFLLFVSDPPEVLGTCANCGAEARAEVDAAARAFGVEEVLEIRQEAVEALVSTRETLGGLEDSGQFDNALTLVPLYRLEAQHMQRLRRATRQLFELLRSSDHAAVRP